MIQNSWISLKNPRTWKYLFKQFYCNHIYSQYQKWVKPNSNNPDLATGGVSYSCRRCGKILIIPQYFAFEIKTPKEMTIVETL